ncbi:hypothetical protein INR49_022983 [Caranx melampygus]|nr:hypothetical protein INR49_022983 [Caranx melampygus]
MRSGGTFLTALTDDMRQPLLLISLSLAGKTICTDRLVFLLFPRRNVQTAHKRL